MSAPAVRRTQQERREETIGRILDATITSLAELGYTATTIGEVCRRSGVSSGGVFRHFPTRLDLMIAAADAVRERQFANFEAGLAALGDEHADISESLRVCLELLRTACRAPMNAAWYELLGAARTDPALREHLAPMAERYHARSSISAGRCRSRPGSRPTSSTPCCCRSCTCSTAKRWRRRCIRSRNSTCDGSN